MNDEGSVPPGWYPDPNGGLRWYDGRDWTEHVQPEPELEPPSPPAGRGMRRAVVGLVGLLLLIAVGAPALALVLTSGDDGVENPRPGRPATTTAPPTDEPSETPTDRPTDTSDPAPGDPAAVVRRFVDAALAGDCRNAESYMTPYLIRSEGGCDPNDLGGAGGEVDYRLGESAIEPGAASVPVTLIAKESGRAQERLRYDIRLVVFDDAWKIDDLGPPQHMR